MDSLGIVFLVFCGGPILFFWIGFFTHKFASRYKITRRLDVAEGAGYAQVTPTGAPPAPSPQSVQSERIRRVRATPDK